MYTDRRKSNKSTIINKFECTSSEGPHHVPTSYSGALCCSNIPLLCSVHFCFYTFVLFFVTAAAAQSFIHIILSQSVSFILIHIRFAFLSLLPTATLVRCSHNIEERTYLSQALLLSSYELAAFCEFNVLRAFSRTSFLFGQPLLLSVLRSVWLCPSE